MKIRDSQAQLNGDETCYVMPSKGLEIVADDGRTLFSISLKDNVLRVDSGAFCKHGGTLLDNEFLIAPHAANCVKLIKKVYEQ